MNEKEFNLNVLAKLVEIANVIFAKLSINIEGTFTAAELWKGKNSLKENIVINYQGTQFDTYDIEVGTFKCSFTPEKVFYLIWKFEQLCKVRQENKACFTFGEPEGEAISEKAMYKSNKGEIITRKKNMVRLRDNIAYSVENGQVNPIKLYFLAGGLWYMVGDAPDKEAMKDRIKSLKQKDFILNNLKRRPELMSEECTLSPIFKALYDVLCADVIKDTPDERKCENEPENVVSCESLRNRPDFTKPFRNHIVMVRRLENGAYHCKQSLLNEVGNGLYRDADNLFFEFGEYCYTLGGYTNGVASFLKGQQDIKAKIVSMIEEGGINTESAKLLYEKLTGHKFGEPAKVEPVHEETSEDYPPEPYNKTGEASCNDEAEITPERKAIRTTFSRQKAFPNELYLQKLKMRRFNRLSFVGYTNYHSRGESVANQTGSGKSGGYSVVAIRGSTG